MVEEQAPVWDKHAKVFRPVRWRDFAVLVQTRAEYSDIERAFERVGLPYVLSTSKDYFGRGETGDLVNLVSLLDSPDDPLFLAGWLASPFSGVESAEAEALIEAALEKRERGSALPLAEAVTRARPGRYGPAGRNAPPRAARRSLRSSARPAQNAAVPRKLRGKCAACASTRTSSTSRTSRLSTSALRGNRCALRRIPAHRVVLRQREGGT